MAPNTVIFPAFLRCRAKSGNVLLCYTTTVHATQHKAAPTWDERQTEGTLMISEDTCCVHLEPTQAEIMCVWCRGDVVPIRAQCNTLQQINISIKVKNKR